MKRIVINLSLVIVSLLLCGLLGEAALRCSYQFISDYNYEMWRYASELKQPLVSETLPFHHKASDGGHYYGVDIRTNSLGMRDVERDIKKPADKKRIVMLGDSFTLGWGVPFSETFPRLLEQKLALSGSNPEVINMGVGNYNSTMEVELFKLKGLSLDPDLVVLMYYINDTEPTPRINRLTYPFVKHSYLLGCIGTKLEQLQMMKTSEDWLLAYYRKIYAPDSAGRSVNSKAIRELIRLCREKNIKLLIVNIPDLRRLKAYPFSFATEYIRGFAEESRVPFLDLLPIFEKYEGQTLWVSPADSHMNSKANGLAADALYNKISNDKMMEK